MKRLDRKRLEALTRLREVEEVLTGDAVLAAEHLSRQAARYTPKTAYNWELSFAAKMAVRAFLGQVDGLGFVMRQVAVDMAPEVGVRLDEQERRELGDARLGLVDSIELAFLYYPSLFGLSFDLDRKDREGEPWRAFLAIAGLGDAMVRPQIMVPLFAAEVFVSLWPALSWFLARLGGMLRACAGTIEEAEVAEVAIGERQVPPFQLAGGRPVVFSEEEHEELRSASLASREHFDEAVDVLAKDTVRSIGFASSISKADKLLATPGQFGLRVLVRTFCAEVETVAALVKLFVLAAAEQGELELSEEDREALEAPGDLEERLVRSLNVWSRGFGSQEQLKAGGPKWQELRTCLRIRERLAHPRSVKDLRISLDEMDAILKAEKCFSQAAELVGLRKEQVSRRK